MRSLRRTCSKIHPSATIGKFLAKYSVGMLGECSLVKMLLACTEDCRVPKSGVVITWHNA